LKAGEPHAVVALAGGLVADGRPLEVQHFGFQLLQHLVRRPLACRMRPGNCHLLVPSRRMYGLHADFAAHCRKVYSMAKKWRRSALGGAHHCNKARTGALPW